MWSRDADLPSRAAEMMSGEADVLEGVSLEGGGEMRNLRGVAQARAVRIWMHCTRAKH